MEGICGAPLASLCLAARAARRRSGAGAARGAGSGVFTQRGSTDAIDEIGFYQAEKKSQQAVAP
ncbi:hypothetical protein DUP91_27530 [Salmonella enterica subsp. enterica]|nr:hypothetical protein [Salmonella enterica subsp. enterica]